MHSAATNWAVDDEAAPAKVKAACKGYQSDSSISWIWENVEDDTENDYDEDEEGDSISSSPLGKGKKAQQMSTVWDMSIINNTGSDDEDLFFDPSARSLNKENGRVHNTMPLRTRSNASLLSCSSRVDVKEKMNKSSSSLVSWDWKEVTQEKGRD